MSGEVYSWGYGENGQLGNGDVQNSEKPIKVDTLTNIKKIEAYKQISIAIDNAGRIYTWGEGYTSMPMRVIFSEKVIDISGTLLLTDKGEVYDLTDLTKKIEGLENIVKISCGEAHKAALTTNGVMYIWGVNNYGECYNDIYGEELLPTIVQDKVLDISAGSCITYLKNENKEIYGFGYDEDGRLGAGTWTNITIPTKIKLPTDVEMEVLSTGKYTHSALVDTKRICLAYWNKCIWRISNR